FEASPVANIPVEIRLVRLADVLHHGLHRQKLVRPFCRPRNDEVVSLSGLLRQVWRPRVPRLDLATWKDVREQFSDTTAGSGEDVDIAARAFVIDRLSHQATTSCL